jgi:hypothetical protein
MNIRSKDVGDAFHLRYPGQRGLVAQGGVEVIAIYPDSVYVVGGSLSVDCVGALKEIPDIDNSFSVTTDTVINETLSIATKLILINVDPTNDDFGEHLITDRFRAIAWQEGAGTNKQGRNVGMPRWNNYWEADSTRPDNCRMPCEGDNSRDSGIMQMNRYWLAPVFEDTIQYEYYPAGRVYCLWDSLSWNWILNIYNAQWWVDSALSSNLQGDQPTWPDSCPYSICDSIPREPNKEDLTNYGYHSGEPGMWAITSELLWDRIIFSPRTLLEADWANYCINVRRWKYNGNLW